MPGTGRWRAVIRRHRGGGGRERRGLLYIVDGRRQSTWTARGSAHAWSAVASSSDGTHPVAVGFSANRSIPPPSLGVTWVGTGGEPLLEGRRVVGRRRAGQPSSSARSRADRSTRPSMPASPGRPGGPESHLVQRRFLHGWPAAGGGGVRRQHLYVHGLRRHLDAARFSAQLDLGRFVGRRHAPGGRGQQRPWLYVSQDSGVTRRPARPDLVLQQVVTSSSDGKPRGGSPRATIVYVSIDSGSPGSRMARPSSGARRGHAERRHRG